MPLYLPGLSRGELRPDEESVQTVISLLDSEKFVSEVMKGNVSLAMIRPKVGPDANLEGLEDAAAADRIEELIEDLGFIAKFSFRFTPETAREFYGGGPQESMSQETPRDPDNYESRWPEFIDFMTSGPTTVILLHNPDGNAIERWREHLGHWNIDEVRDLSTIRGALGVNKYNNLVHGSDAPESVLREVEIIKKCLEADLND